MKRTSFQSGSVVLKPRKRGHDVWVLRYMDEGKQKSEILGTKDKFRTKAAARKESLKRIKEINDYKAGIVVSALCDRFKKSHTDVRSKTIATYQGFVKRIREDLGSMRIDELTPLNMEAWVNSLCTLATEDRVSARGEAIQGRPSRSMAKKSKLHYKATLHLLLEFAMKHQLMPLQRNPVTLIKLKRGGPARVRQTTLLTGKQYQDLIADPDLSQHVRVMIQVAMLLGIRISEVLGLRWDAIDFKAATVAIRVSVVGKNADDTKTLASEDVLPMHEDLAAILEEWKHQNTSEFGEDASVNGWLFGNPLTGRPFWGGTLQQDHLVPAGRKVGIASLGWHDFRHTYAAMMDDEGIDLDTRKKLMRHSDIAMTLKYGHRKSNVAKTRPANAQVVEMMRRRA